MDSPQFIGKEYQEKARTKEDPCSTSGVTANSERFFGNQAFPFPHALKFMGDSPELIHFNYFAIFGISSYFLKNSTFIFGKLTTVPQNPI
jgi:hypothetical protein